MGYIEPTIHERIEMGFLSDTPTGKAQIRTAKVRMFFHDYDQWLPEVDDGSCLQEREHELQITPDEWAAFHKEFEIEF